jgi:hypothetical protein
VRGRGRRGTRRHRETIPKRPDSPRGVDGTEIRHSGGSGREKAEVGRVNEVESRGG